MIYSTKDIRVRVIRERKAKKQFATFSLNSCGGTICLLSAGCVNSGGATTRRAILQYDSDTNILSVIPTLDTDRITTVTLTRANSSGSGRSISVTGFFNYAGLSVELGRYLAKGTPDGVEIYLNAKL